MRKRHLCVRGDLQDQVEYGVGYLIIKAISENKNVIYLYENSWETLGAKKFYDFCRTRIFKTSKLVNAKENIFSSLKEFKEGSTNLLLVSFEEEDLKDKFKALIQSLEVLKENSILVLPTGLFNSSEELMDVVFQKELLDRNIQLIIRDSLSREEQYSKRGRFIDVCMYKNV